MKRKVGALSSRHERERQRRERFWTAAQGYVSALTVRDRFGNEVTVNTGDDWVGRITFLEGSFDPGNVDSVVAVLAERGYMPEIVLDVGANIGTSTLELMSIYPDACAVAIEPHPDNYRLLRMNVIGNRLEGRVRTVNTAVGDSTGTATMSVNTAGNAGDHRIACGDEPNTIDVPMARLCDLACVDRPALLWIDVQGYEGHVFRGAGDLLGCPALVEFWPEGLKRAGGYRAFLEAVGTYGTVIEAREEVRPVRDLEELATELEARRAYTDLLLLP